MRVIVVVASAHSRALELVIRSGRLQFRLVELLIRDMPMPMRDQP